MRDYQAEFNKRVEFVKNALADAHAEGIVYGNSGGKDCTLTAIICKKACDNLLGVIMPCESKQNYTSDTQDALTIAKQFNIETVTVDLTKVKGELEQAIASICEIKSQASNNIAPRLRMTTLYTIAQSRNALVCGTGNLSEITMGYFTKWGDGGYDFNPIADLTATEVFEFLRFLDAPKSIIEKAPSAGLFEGQTDEKEMGVTYEAIDRYIETGEGDEKDITIIERANKISEHKRILPRKYNS